ncbi:DEAD/DEAH box helicase [Moorella sp. Hama-1]|uniref:DEAD/DEAH box helicase n=1 Tax=Moorella sp. Hama-1 TaxID=2138101 RepID=UPI000D656508|nr:helicase-related protein [Moorella sp. Hama-1]BCV22764.1 helicase [Moorella sp. Hama-1]
MNPGEWVWLQDKSEAGKIIEVQTVWGDSICRVWLPSRDAVVRVRADQLKPLDSSGAMFGPHHVAYIAAAARVADAMARNLLLAPVAADIIPLPHQIQALARAVAGDRVRYLLADEVGLGKTIEAGLIMRELKLRGLVRRTLVIAPKGLVTQWVAEMRNHFNEDFQLLIPGDCSAYRRFTRAENLWRTRDQVVCPLDAVKPITGRRGWSREQVDDYNRERFADLITAGWDLVIVDEAHRLAGSTDQVARYKLGRGLAEAAPYLLLLSATPHQGKSDAFYRLMALLDSQAFPGPEAVTRERVRLYIIRTEKRQAIDGAGRPLFQPRQTRLIPVAWEERHRYQRRLYEAVTDYVREGYNQALREKRNYIGFLLVLMQRLVTSSTRAIRTALERRLEMLQAPVDELALFPTLPEGEWADLDGQEQLDTLLRVKLQELHNEQAEVDLLLQTARAAESAGPDPKAEALLEWIYRLQQEEADPDLKVLVFTEFVATQEMLRDFLAARGFTVACLNGSMGLEERAIVQESFAGETRILISTDAGGEGLNLQFCHVVINYDIPWNPMRLEQRIGRVDRIGQKHPVRAVNFVLEDTVEHRVQEVLAEKLVVIFNEFGVDKTGDVLDSEQAGEVFDDLYLQALLHPEDWQARVETTMNQLLDQVKEARQQYFFTATGEGLDPGEAQRLLAHPLPCWVERMTVSYLRAYGGQVEQQDKAWKLTWPDGEQMARVTFTGSEATFGVKGRQLTLEDPRIRGLVIGLSPFAPGQPIPVVSLPGLAAGVQGFWSLWRIELHGLEGQEQRIMPHFLHDDGRELLPTSRFIWERLLEGELRVTFYCSGEESGRMFAKVKEAAEARGKPLYDELVQAHRLRLDREREKGEFSFAARRRALERIGLPAVRAHRLAQLDREQQEWSGRMEQQALFLPEMVPLLLLRVEEAGAG